MVMGAALLLSVVPFAAQPFLRVSVDALETVEAGAFVGSLVGVLVLVSVPVMLLGAAAPYAIRLAVPDVERAGEVAGRLYAVSTAGSLVGTMLSALLLIPFVGTQRTFLVFALALAVVAAWGLGWRYAAVPAALAVLVTLPVGAVKGDADGRVLFEDETAYQYVRVVERDDGDRVLELNEGQAVHSLYRPGTYLTGDYWDGYLVLPFAASEQPPRRALMLGNAGGSIARAYGRYLPRTWFDAVEIDGELTDLGRRYLDLRNARMRTFTEDARPFLARSDLRYDAIMVDVYRQPYIPFYLTTKRVLRGGSRSPDRHRHGDHQRRASRGERRPGAGPRSHPGGGLPVRQPGPGRGDEHPAGGRRAADLGGAHAPRDPVDAAGGAPPGGRGGGDACAPAPRRRGLHRRPRAGRVAGGPVDPRLRQRALAP